MANQRATKEKAAAGTAKKSGAKGTAKAASRKTGKSAGAAKASATGGKKKTSSSPARNYEEEDEIPESMRDEIVLAVTLLVSVLFFLSYVNLCGTVGKWLNYVIFGLIGIFGYFFPFVLFLTIAFWLANKGNRVAKRKIWSLLGGFLCIAALVELASGYQAETKWYEYFALSAAAKSGGGIAGGIVVRLLCPLFETVATAVILVALLIICLMLLTGKELFAYLKRLTDETMEERRISAEERALRRQEEEESYEDLPEERHRARVITFPKGSEEDLEKLVEKKKADGESGEAIRFIDALKTRGSKKGPKQNGIPVEEGRIGKDTKTEQTEVAFEEMAEEQDLLAAMEHISISGQYQKEGALHYEEELKRKFGNQELDQQEEPAGRDTENVVGRQVRLIMDEDRLNRKTYRRGLVGEDGTESWSLMKTEEEEASRRFAGIEEETDSWKFAGVEEDTGYQGLGKVVNIADGQKQTEPPELRIEPAEKEEEEEKWGKVEFEERPGKMDLAEGVDFYPKGLFAENEEEGGVLPGQAEKIETEAIKTEKVNPEVFFSSDSPSRLASNGTFANDTSVGGIAANGNSADDTSEDGNFADGNSAIGTSAKGNYADGISAVGNSDIGTSAKGNYANGIFADGNSAIGDSAIGIASVGVPDDGISAGMPANGYLVADAFSDVSPAAEAHATSSPAASGNPVARAYAAGGFVAVEGRQTQKESGREDNLAKEDSSAAQAEIARQLEQVVVEKKYEFPPLELLAPPQPGKGANERELKETAMKLQKTLESFGVHVMVNNISCGPTVTQYELQPEQGVKVSQITKLSDDIKLNMAAADIRIEAPIPGKAAVGIEIPNKENTPVLIRELLESEEFQKHKSKLAFAVGKNISGQTIVADIAKMPHLLIAGATGSGKSVCINTIIMSILYKADPADVRLIMVDPKVVELSVYNGIPHLLIPVVTDPKKASAALNWAVAEMTDRYNKFAELGVRDLAGYNEKIASIEEKDPKYQKLPQIVIIVDELADLMMVASGEVEEAICRLAQLARAAGLHLVIATQRPTVNVITGLIKANVPSRIAFAVASAVDSRTILDGVGAEKLLGKGDMLFFPSGYPKPVRIQGAFVSDAEVSSVVDFLKEQSAGSGYNEEVSKRITSTAAEGASSSERDDYFVEAGRFIIEKEKASIGMLQRVYKIGFNRAARIMDQLTAAGVVGPEEGTKPRKILMTMEEFEEYIENMA